MSSFILFSICASYCTLSSVRIHYAAEIRKKHFNKAKERILRHPKYMLLKSNEMNEQKEIPQHLKKNNVKNQKEFSYYMPSAFLISQRLKA